MKSIKGIFAFIFALLASFFTSSTSLNETVGVNPEVYITSPNPYYNPGRRSKYKASGYHN